MPPKMQFQPVAQPQAKNLKRPGFAFPLALFLIGLVLCVGLGFLGFQSNWTFGMLKSRTQKSDLTGMVSIDISSGKFQMGSAPGNITADSDEQPQHSVQLDEYWIDQTEVTNDMFAQFVAKTSYTTEAEKSGWGYVIDPATQQLEKVAGANWNAPQGLGKGSSQGNYPVVQVSWDDAQAFCRWAGGSLPSEAQWEKAAAWDGTNERSYPWGNQSPDGKKANFADRRLQAPWASAAVDDGYQYAAPVGNYPEGASSYGVLDMAGNIAEWAGDWYDANYYQNSPAVNPGGPANGQLRVVRGGSWDDDYRGIRTTNRDSLDPAGSYNYVGLRCVRR
jgi:formylglycine-generating enzyme required for sulfatase activity